MRTEKDSHLHGNYSCRRLTKKKMKKGKGKIQSILDAAESKEKSEERDQKCWGQCTMYCD